MAAWSCFPVVLIGIPWRLQHYTLQNTQYSFTGATLWNVSLEFSTTHHSVTSLTLFLNEYTHQATSFAEFTQNGQPGMRLGICRLVVPYCHLWSLSNFDMMQSSASKRYNTDQNNTFFRQNEYYQSLWWQGHPPPSDQPHEHQDVHTPQALLQIVYAHHTPSCPQVHPQEQVYAQCPRRLTNSPMSWHCPQASQKSSTAQCHASRSPRKSLLLFYPNCRTYHWYPWGSHAHLHWGKDITCDHGNVQAIWWPIPAWATDCGHYAGIAFGCKIQGWPCWPTDVLLQGPVFSSQWS